MKKIWMCISLLFASCSSIPERNLKDSINVITDCPSAPHCVSSHASDQDRQISAILYKGSLQDFQTKIKTAIGQLPRTEIVKAEGPYVHAEATSAILRFTDDLELYFVQAESKIHVRSSSRTGYYDFDVNRSRVEKLREIISGNAQK